VLIPQALAYALLLGLPPINGLYAAVFGVAAGALWGSSRQMVTGPVGVMSLLTLTALLPFSGDDPARLIAAATILAIFVGLMQFALGAFRLGFLMRLVPDSVLTGFSVGAAVVIGVTQIPALVGIVAQQHSFFLATIIGLARSWAAVEPLTLVVGLASVVLIFAFRRLGQTFPAALATMALATLACFVFKLSEHGVAVIGTVPQSLPALTKIHLSDFLSIGTSTFSLALVGFLSALSVAKSLAAHTSEHVDVNQELIGQGMANMASGLFGGYPVSGSFSLTALNFASGARTILSSLVAALCMIVAIFALTPLLFYLPRATLAAVIIASVIQVVRPKDIVHLYELSPTDGIIATLTCLAAFILQPQDAVLIGVVVALLLFLRNAMFAQVPEVGYHPEWHTLEARDTFPQVLNFPRSLIVRVDYSFVYANAERIVEEIDNRIYERELREGGRVRALVCNFSGVNTIDASGLEALKHLVEDMRGRGVHLAVAYLKHPVQVALERSQLLPAIPHLHNIDEIRAFCTRFAKLEPPITLRQ
jgi:SulP family sulfate permease